MEACTERVENGSFTTLGYFLGEDRAQSQSESRDRDFLSYSSLYGEAPRQNCHPNRYP